MKPKGSKQKPVQKGKAKEPVVVVEDTTAENVTPFDDEENSGFGSYLRSTSGKIRCMRLAYKECNEPFFNLIVLNAIVDEKRSMNGSSRKNAISSF